MFRYYWKPNLNRQAVSRLDCYYEPNERKYFITPQSVGRASEEKRAKATTTERMPHGSAPFGHLPQASAAAPRPQEQAPETGQGMETPTQRLAKLEKEGMDLKITNRATDYCIDHLKADREHFAQERAAIMASVAEGARKIGELETTLLQFEPPGPEEKREERA